MFLRMTNLRSGGVRISAVDRNGIPVDAGHIMTITPQGVLRCHVGVNPELLLQLDHEGRIIVDNRG